MDAPVRLLKPDESHTTLVANPEALTLLEALEGPVSVLSIIGAQRGGKSSILNLFHSRQLSHGCNSPRHCFFLSVLRSAARFGIGHSMNACTHGLWMWIRAHPRNPVRVYMPV